MVYHFDAVSFYGCTECTRSINESRSLRMCEYIFISVTDAIRFSFLSCVLLLGRRIGCDKTHMNFEMNSVCTLQRLSTAWIRVKTSTMRFLWILSYLIFALRYGPTYGEHQHRDAVRYLLLTCIRCKVMHFKCLMGIDGLWRDIALHNRTWHFQHESILILVLSPTPILVII